MGTLLRFPPPRQTKIAPPPWPASTPPPRIPHAPRDFGAWAVWMIHEAREHCGNDNGEYDVPAIHVPIEQLLAHLNLYTRPSRRAK
jgi:hypothetical protein